MDSNAVDEVPALDLAGLRARLIGQKFPGGRVTVERWTNWLMCDIAGADPRTDEVHPVFGFIAPLSAMGISVDEIFALCEFSAADGPMLGSTRIEFYSEIQMGEAYLVSGRIIDLQRKTGRRAGVFDLMTFELALSRASDDIVVASTRNTFVLPRRSLC